MGGDERAARTRARILDAAEKVFAEKGLAGARVDEIADRAAINKRMLYAHFGGKEALYKAALERVYLRLGACEEVVIRRGDGSWQRRA
jgi:AcrR family transcriptional regulator